jgi:uncharacterized membrane protein YecN with MAPEG domain
MVTITAFYAALLSLLFIVLSRNVIVQRRRQRVALGAEGNPELLRRVRAQDNFAEYAPLAVILMAFAEIQGLMPVLVHALGSSLLAGRLLHAFGLSRSPEDFRFRVAGMSLTFAVVGVAAIANLVLSAGAWLSGG